MTVFLLAIIALALLPLSIPAILILITLAFAALPFVACALSGFLLFSGALEAGLPQIAAAAVMITSGMACAALIQAIGGK